MASGTQPGEKRSYSPPEYREAGDDRGPRVCVRMGDQLNLLIGNGDTTIRYICTVTDVTREHIAVAQVSAEML